MGTDEGRYREAERRLWKSVGISPTERYLQLTRTGATVRVQEAGNGPPVLLVHGASNSGVSWAELVTRLDGFRWIVLDRPGCGLSPVNTTDLRDFTSFETFADGLIADVLDAMDLDRAHVIATSFGGYMALRGAAAHSDRFDRMVLMGWSFGASIGHVPLVMRVAAIPLVGRMMAAIPANERAVRTIFKSVGLRQALEAGRVSQEMIDAYVSLLRDTDTMKHELRAGPRIMRPIAGFDERTLLSPELLGRVKTPTLFLWGDEDPMGGATTARPFSAHLPNAELELMGGAGHAVWIDDPDHVAKAVTTFLRA